MLWEHPQKSPSSSTHPDRDQQSSAASLTPSPSLLGPYPTPNAATRTGSKLGLSFQRPNAPRITERRGDVLWWMGNGCSAKGARTGGGQTACWGLLPAPQNPLLRITPAHGKADGFLQRRPSAPRGLEGRSPRAELAVELTRASNLRSAGSGCHPISGQSAGQALCSPEQARP